MAEVIIRDAKLDDLEEIVAIYNSTIPGRMVTADTEAVSVQERLKWFEEHSPDFRPLWVMQEKENTEIAGWLSYQSFYGRPAYNATAEVSIYIHPNHRRKGYGKLFLDKAIIECPRLHIKTLLGFIFAHNLPSLQLFYDAGFANWAHLPGIAELDGIERDLIILGKRIG